MEDASPLPPPGAAKPSFYSRIMGLKAKGKGGGGGGAKVQKIRRSEEEENWQKILLESHLGEGRGSFSQADYFAEHLKRLSEKELTLLERKVKKLAKSVIPEGNPEIRKSLHLLKSTLERQIQKGNEEVDNLRQQVRVRYQSLPPHVRQQCAQCRPVRQSKRLKETARLHFSDIATTYDSLVAQGKILPTPKRPHGMAFVVDALLRLRRA